MLLLPPISTRTDTPLPYTPLFRSPSACANVAHRRPKKPGNAGLFRLSSRSPPLLLLLYRFQGSPACRALAPHRDALERRTARPVRARPVAQAHPAPAGALAAGAPDRAPEQPHPRRLVHGLAVPRALASEPPRNPPVPPAPTPGPPTPAGP